MKLQDHCLRTEELLGFACIELHIYIDMYYPYFRSEVHRVILHHERGARQLARRFGHLYGPNGKDIAYQAAIIHIKDDLGWVPEEPSDLLEHVFPLNDDEELVEELLSHEFF